MYFMCTVMYGSSGHRTKTVDMALQLATRLLRYSLRTADRGTACINKER
jgi:hypothetical protein